MKTEDLIDRLARDLAPVQPLPRPTKRAVTWLVGAAIYVGAFVLLARSGSAALTDPSVLLPQLVALVTCALAASAAFASVVPGHSRIVLAAPVIAGAAWLGMLATGATWSSEVVAGATHEWACVSLIVLGGAPLLAALAVMLRRGAPFHPGLTGAFGALAVGALWSAGACFWRPHANDAVTLVWHGGAIALVVVACVLGARRVLAPEK